MTNYWLINVKQKSNLWSEWIKEKIISIGLNIGDISQLSLEEIKSNIQNNPKYNKKSEETYNYLRLFIGLESGIEAMEEGDYVIILNKKEIFDIVIIGTYLYRPNGLTSDKNQVYCRQARFLKKGPMKIADLPKEFHFGGKYDIQLVDLLRKFNIAKEDFEKTFKIDK